MTVRRVALALVILVIGSTVAVGATTPSPTATPDADEPPLGLQLTEFMQASAAQADGSVGNGLWVAAFARSSNESERRVLVEGRIGSLDASLAELHAERRDIQAAYRNGSIDRMTYRARLSAIVGQLAALGDGIEDAGERGQAVGVDATRLDTLRSQARTLGGGEVSQLARNLTGGQDPPGQSGVFGDDRPGPGGDGPPGQAGNGQGPPTDRGPGQSSDGNSTATDTETPTDEDS